MKTINETRLREGEKRIGKMLLAVGVLVSLSGCGSIPAVHNTLPSGEKNGAATPLPRAELPLAIRFLPTCPISKKGSVETPGLLAALGISAATTLAEKVIPATVGFLYDQGVDWLNEQQLRLSASSTAYASNTFYASDGTEQLGFGCIVLVRGNFSALPPKELSTPMSMQNNDHWAPYWHKGIVLDNFDALKISGPPELYAEYAITPILSPVTTGTTTTGGSRISYWKLSPVLVDYFGSGAKDNPSPKKNVLVNIKIESVAKPNAGTIFSREYDLGFLEIGKRHNTEYLDGDIIALPARDKSNNGTVDVVPIKVSVVITETEPGRDYSRALAKALGEEEAKNKFVDGIANQVVTKVKEKLNGLAGSDDKGNK